MKQIDKRHFKGIRFTQGISFLSFLIYTPGVYDSLSKGERLSDTSLISAPNRHR